MTKLLSPILAQIEPGNVIFACPGCMDLHVIRISGEGRPCWGYNGDPLAPTFTPSILVRSVQTVQNENYEWTGEWVYGPDGKALPSICHSFVTDGRIQFLPDCTHNLAGQTVAIPLYPKGAVL